MVSSLERKMPTFGTSLPINEHLEQTDARQRRGDARTPSTKRPSTVYVWKTL